MFRQLWHHVTVRWTQMNPGLKLQCPTWWSNMPHHVPWVHLSLFYWSPALCLLQRRVQLLDLRCRGGERSLKRGGSLRSCYLEGSHVWQFHFPTTRCLEGVALKPSWISMALILSRFLSYIGRSGWSGWMDQSCRGQVCCSWSETCTSLFLCRSMYFWQRYCFNNIADK